MEEEQLDREGVSEGRVAKGCRSLSVGRGRRQTADGTTTNKLPVSPVGKPTLSAGRQTHAIGRGVLFFTVIVLIGTGWSFLKPFLQDREKKVLMIVIPLQVLANIASAVIGETGPFIQGWVTWNQVFLLIDIACCCAIIFPIIWSIRTLKETSKTDGKAARTLAKLSLFRQFYMAVIGYLYFTRIVVYALKTIASYKYRWVSVAAEETVSFAFYVVMFYMFRPKERNEYFALDDEEEQAAEAALREEEFEL
ncbi:protein CANDIDATE G-PROTEIN COUPLED RECEPTOR 7-like [Musa acuminata AAA Group]|uniref:protein CANDIDATE G-PROTEIN COUPLED RECEPTOR 7-like n=1 Tax=Musa acuminata AAA Group TaxID=214697 RepID=UPI0031E3A794